MRIMILAACVALSGCAAAQAQTQPTPAQLLAGLAGEWDGALGYRDYQSNQLFELEMHSSVRLADGGHTLIRTSRYDEGRNPDVFIVSASAFDTQSGLYETAGFRAGRPMSLTRERVGVQSVRDDRNWVLVFTERGTDNDKPADIRVTLTRTGDDTLAVKEVDYLDDPAVRFEFRNQTRLRRAR